MANWNNHPPDPDAYMRLLRAAYQAAKQSCPSLVVVSAAPVPTGAPLPFAMDDIDYLAALYTGGLANSSDAVGVRLPGYNLSPDTPVADAPHRSFSFAGTLAAYRELWQRNGSAGAMWVTEFGWPAGPSPEQAYAFVNDTTPQEQAEWTVRAIELLRASGFVDAAFLWTLDGATNNPNGPIAMWSAVDPGWNPRPVYTALQQMAK